MSAATIKSDLEILLSPKALISLPGSVEFFQSNLRFTEYERPTYLITIRPSCIEDVIQTVRYARSAGIPFSPRAGHHCVTSTMRHLKDGILLDMRSLNALSFNKQCNQVTVGGGVITDDLVRFLEHHKMEVNVGSCPTTGVIGVSFGAGLGRLQGKYGLLHDNMVSCKLVLADDSLISVSKDSHPDLFWAIRGAGHNFGVAVEATFQVYPQASGGIHYSWDLEFGLEQCDGVFQALNDVHAEMPAEMAIFVLWNRLSKSGLKHLILVNIVWSGPEVEAYPWVRRFQVLKPLVDNGNTRASWSELPWITYNGLNSVLSKPEVWSKAPFKMMGAVSIETFDLPTTKAFLYSLRDMNERWTGKGTFGAMFECLPHHRVREIPDESTAFPWRRGSNHFLMMTATPLDLVDREIFEGHVDRWKKEFVTVSGYGRLQQYVNYGNTTSSLKDPAEALYGYEPWRLKKLRSLKEKYDAENVFRWYQPLVEETGL